MLKRILVFFLILFLVAGVAGAAALLWGYNYITRDLPQLSSIEDYRPPAVTTVLATDGTVIAEFFKERRYPVKLKEVPKFAQDAFVAAEDATFYTHPGIDLISIFRALIKNLETGQMRQGGSTITQQVVKNLLLTPEKKIERKLKEAILSYQLERRFSKQEILEIYLNQIFFGNTAYGIKAAARVYFDKELSDLTLAEAALLAGLPKAPTRYSPLLHFKAARKRQRYVLNQMVKSGFITRQAADLAFKEELKIQERRRQNLFESPYYAAEIRREFPKRWPELDLDRDGLVIHAAVDLRANAMGERALRRGLREVDRRRGWRGPLASLGPDGAALYHEKYAGLVELPLSEETAVPALVTKLLPRSGRFEALLGTQVAIVDVATAAWAKRMIDSKDRVRWVKPFDVLRVGDVVEVGLNSEYDPSQDSSAVPMFVLDQTPDIEGALILLDPHSGRIAAMIGGYSYQRSKFNRATQSLRQPGSAFKPILYLAAIDGFGYTPATIVYDVPRSFRAGDEFWEPDNFDHTFLGEITLRTALERSRNLASAHIIANIGPEAVIQYARRLGIRSRLGPNLSLSLGSSETTVLEMVKAYGVFAARGVLFPSVMVTRIEDRYGNELYSFTDDRLLGAEQVISEESAFVMANLMKGVVQRGTGYRVRAIDRPTAGKTGTSNDQMDAWFIGYTPEWVCGVWVGFDLKKKIGEKETGGRAASPIWLYFMSEFLDYQDELAYAELVEEAKTEAERLGLPYEEPGELESLDFPIPDGVDPFWVDRATGMLSKPDAPGAILDYFIRGTQPTEQVGDYGAGSYFDLPE